MQKNFFNLIINQGINIFIALLTTRILFSTLGEAQYGLVNLALSVVLLSSITVSYGYHLNGPKRIALFRDESKNSIFNLVRIYEQIDYNEELKNSTMVTQGNFQWKNGIKDTEVMFYPNKDGRFYITWVPDQSIQNNIIIKNGMLNVIKCF